MNWYKKIGLSVCSGVLLYLSWAPRFYLTFLIFLAFIPLLFVVEYNQKHKKHNYFYPFLTFLLWNILTLNWLYYASFYGFVFTVVLNAFFMSLPWLFFYRIYLNKSVWGFVCLVLFWLSFEYLHYNWDISFPWLSIGNVFAMHPNWVQWYEYTGVAGGSLWVLVINILFFDVLRKKSSWFILKKWCVFLAMLLCPLVLSYSLFFYYKKTLMKQANYDDYEVVVVQPNLNAYTEKFYLPDSVQIHDFLKIAEQHVNAKTRLILLPETALVGTFWEHNYKQSPSIQQLIKWLTLYDSVNVLGGASTNVELERAEFLKKPSVRSFVYDGGVVYYESYNTSFLLKPDSGIYFYHKSQLVPAAEKMPFQKHLTFLGDFMLNLGGTNGTLGVQDTPSVFCVNAGFKIAPLVCYESIYGNFITKFVKKGANIIAVITNDGWWEDTDGYKQHCAYSLLRAIETRKFIYRSANTGISAIINPLGEKLQQLAYNQKGAICGVLKTTNTITFYVTCGDWIYYFSSILTLIIFFALLLRGVIKVFQKQKE